MMDKDRKEPIRENLITELLVILFTIFLGNSLVLIFTGLNKTLDEVICGKFDAAVKERKGVT